MSFIGGWSHMTQAQSSSIRLEKRQKSQQPISLSSHQKQSGLINSTWPAEKYVFLFVGLMSPLAFSLASYQPKLSAQY